LENETMAETAQIANGISGDKRYQERARRALPLLVRQAQAFQPITYSDLASELGMSNPRTLNYVLGAIGQALKRLAVDWAVDIPAIQCLVVNKHTGLPGEGVGWFITSLDDFKKLNRKQQRNIVQAELQRVFAFNRWPAVLEEFGLKPKPLDYRTILHQAASFVGGGESTHHRALKEFVAGHPDVIGLPSSVGPGETEHPLPSGDCLDVFFQDHDDFVAVEVKSSLSNTADVVRGMFQCIKYRAVMEALQATRGLAQNARAILVLQGEVPAELIPMRNVLGIEVVEKIEPC